MKATRSSNFELLRLLAMLMIVFYHCLDRTLATMPNDSVIASFYNVSHWGVPVFLLISGYFMTKLSWGKILSFWFYCATWMLISYILSLVVGGGNLSIIDLVLCFLPFSHTNLWFVPLYFWLMLLSPFINAGINKLQLKEISTLCVIILSAVMYASICWKSPNVAAGHSILYFVSIYILGATMRRLNDASLLNLDKKYILICICILLAVVMVATYLLPASLQRPLKGLVFFYVSPALIISSILIFLYFSKINITNKAVNSISGSAFAVYLFHENYHSHNLIYGFVDSLSNTFTGYALVLAYFIFALLLMCVVILIDKAIREPISKVVVSPIAKLLNNIISLNFQNK